MAKAFVSCSDCGNEFLYDGNTTCPACRQEEVLVSKASRPSLATLFKAGKKRGLIIPVFQYTNV